MTAAPKKTPPSKMDAKLKASLDKAADALGRLYGDRFPGAMIAVGYGWGDGHSLRLEVMTNRQDVKDNLPTDFHGYPLFTKLTTQKVRVR